MTIPVEVVAVGHVTCDITCPLEGWPERDTKTILPAIELCGGGPAANAAATLSRLGINTGLVGRLGDDLLGHYSFQDHEQAGLDVSHLVIDQRALSPVSVILSDLGEGTRTILLTKGKHTTLDVEDLDWEWLKGARVIHLDGHQMRASLAIAAKAQQWPNTITTLDAGSMREGMVELAELCDIVICSHRFAREFTGSNDPWECISQIKQHGAKQVGVTLGSSGCCFFRRVISMKYLHLTLLCVIRLGREMHFTEDSFLRGISVFLLRSV